MVRWVLSMMLLMVVSTAAVAHPGHEHAADRSFLEQLAHPAFGWTHYALFTVTAVAIIGFAAWRRGRRSER